MKTIVKMIGILFSLIACYFIGVILLAQLTYYQPKEIVELETNAKNSSEITDSTLQLFLWNIGFAGLGAESDFFYDGGKMVRSSKALNTKYWGGIESVVRSQIDENTDFILLQEVDVKSKRSRYVNQVETLSEASKQANFATNYKVNYVPLQLTKPLGKVKSGLLSLSMHAAKKATRVQFPGSYSWPNKLFFLRRCALVQRFSLSFSEKELVIINTHLSAYDDGSLKQQEMEYLKEMLETEYAKGNFVIVGADWNQEPESEEIQSFLPNWEFVYDDTTPTNRSLEAPYTSTSTTKVIDYYLVSPNVKVNSVTTVDLDFAYSDHQPVQLAVTLGE